MSNRGDPFGFDTVLIANRGEIALRVIRACRELGLRSVAVYSTVDRDSLAVRLADDRVAIGPAPARNSYLSIPAIVEAARHSGAQAIHPGYGFLSEDPDFAEVCEAEGLLFIGPPAKVLARLGDKSTARALMSKVGLPLLPGTTEPVSDVTEAERIASEIGYPVIVKAVAGGGGRGMSVITDPADLQRIFQQTQANALALFGDSRVYLERYLPTARHVEIQVLCDRYGNAVWLGARDCSVQRRRQKLVEETPPPGLNPALIERMGEDAVCGALAAEYVGAATFEFLVDDQGRHYFMEVNCRIQVEHPVTEMVTGVDLVAEQLRIAAGQPLSLRQPEITLQGAAIECRVNAEDPQRGFIPTPGRLTEYWPPAGPFVRVDSHAFPGYEIPATYDPLLAKVVVWAPDRPRAIVRMRRALSEFTVSGPGVATTLDFLDAVMRDPRFVSATHDTSLVDQMTSERTAQ